MEKTSDDPKKLTEGNVSEFSFKAVVLGAFFGLLFGATTVYLGLKVGLTVGASIPVAVITIALFKKFGNSTILENNIVQTMSQTGESIAAGIAFTLPAFLFFNDGAQYFHFFQIYALTLIGGILGVLFMTPLRKALIVQEHAHLPYPEGIACADILIVGEKKGELARNVFYGAGLAFIYKLGMSIIGLWKEIPTYIFSKKSSLPNAIIAAEITPELLGIGYIIGIRIAGTLLAGGVLSSFVLIPLISYLGESLTMPLAPSTKLISQMTTDEIRLYIRYIAAGAVTLGGLITMFRTFPVIMATFKETLFKDTFGSKNKQIENNTDKDISFSFILGGIIFLFILMIVLPYLPITIYSAIIILIAGFFFSAVSSRIVGILGCSSNPVSGMTISTLVGTCLIFVSWGLTGDAYQSIALAVGGIVAVAAANAGASAQSIKTGYLVGGTPYKQQIAIIIAVAVSALTIGLTITLLNETLGFGVASEAHPHALPAPQANLMATIIKGMLSQHFPWPLFFIGMAIAAAVEICGIHSLPFAVGAYLPISTTTSLFIGSVVKGLVQKTIIRPGRDSNLEPGALFSSGLISGGAITGILIAILVGVSVGVTKEGKSITLMDKINTHLGQSMGELGSLISLGIFLLLSLSIYGFAMQKRKKL